MAATGFIDLPSTTHFAFEYNKELDRKAAEALGAALIETAERDFLTMMQWFSGATPQGGVIDTKINLADGGASNENVNNINLRLGPTGNFDLARQVLVAEVMEIFMAANSATAAMRACRNSAHLRYTLTNVVP